MDINLPGINGIEATRRIRAAHPETQVILLSTYSEADLPADAAKCGAIAYVHKEDFGPALVRELWDQRAADRARSALVDAAVERQPAAHLRVPRRARSRPTSEPPIAPSRSAMFTKPWPFTARCVASKPAPLSATSKHELVRLLGDGDREARALARVLAGVLHRLEAAEVDRGLDVGRVATDVGYDVGRRAPHGSRRRAAPRRARGPSAAAGRCRARARAAG